MNIALVSEHASPLAALGGVDAGGQNVHVHALALALARRGHHVEVLTRRDAPRLARRVPMAPGVDVVHVHAGPPVPIAKDDLLPLMGEFAADLRQMWTARPPDLVHAHFWMSGLATAWAAEPLRIPTALTYHALGREKRAQQGTKDTSPPNRCDIEDALARRVGRILATSSEEIRTLVRMGAPRERVSLVPCGVDTEWFRPDGPAELRPRRLRRVVVLSRLVERKGIGNVVEALTRLPGTELVVAGGPPLDRLRTDKEAQRLDRLARSLGVRDRVVLRGRIERADAPALLRSADVVVCAPWYEPFGLVALEAMACGVPVVASAVGGLLDTVIHEGTGLHVPPRDPGAIAEAVGRLLDDPALRASLGAAGAARTRSRYDWRAVAAATELAYDATQPHPARWLERQRAVIA